jgi:PleD family two-component response regulator
VSLGVACVRDIAGFYVEGILERADAALYRAKAAGRDCIHVTYPGSVRVDAAV